MPWYHFKSDYDHRWPSGAVTAFKEGMKVHVKQEVAEAADAVKAGSPLQGKPKETDKGYIASPTRVESARPARTGNSVLSNAHLGRDERMGVTRTPDTDAAVTGEALSPASGGEPDTKAAAAAEAANKDA